MDRAGIQERFGITGASQGVLNAIDRVRQVARTNISVLIQGESGVGKELFAQALHGISDRRHEKMIVVNCGAIPEGLIESELFGAEKGAYTGAVERRTGYFEQADGGTIFLDEIGEMPLAAQVRLLRVLENGTFTRVGASKLQHTDVRVVAATNKDLGHEVTAGRFREDLYYRLSTVILTVPPLRDRREDILPIFEQYLHTYTQQYNTPPKRLSDEARMMLLRYRWPGNVRELRNVAEQSVVLVRGDTITPDHLESFVRGVSASGAAGGLVRVGEAAQEDDPTARERGMVYRALVEMQLEIRGLKEQVGSLVKALGSTFSGSVAAEPANDGGQLFIGRDDELEGNFASYFEDIAYEIEPDPNRALPPHIESEATDEEEDPDGQLPTLEDAERLLITKALERFDGNRRQTAKALGISERTLYRKIKEFDEEEAVA